MKMSYRFIEDPGHGWLEVDRAEVERLGVSVSSYSYIRGSKVYLEEDCDMGRFVEAKKAAGEPVEWIPVYQENTPIRGYLRWGQR
jgi:hypothetical protein